MQKLGLAAAVIILVAGSIAVLGGAAETPNSEGKILFYSERDGNAEIYLMDADGSGLTRLTTNSANEWSPAGSPDGTEIAFESERDDPNPASCFPNCMTKLHLMSVDGSGERRLMDLPGAEGHPDWSPDGRSLVFVSDRDGNDEIHVMNVDGADVTRITSNAAHDWMSAWSADGTEILFSSDRDGSQLDVYAVRLDDLTVRRLTTATGYESVWRP